MDSSRSSSERCPWTGADPLLIEYHDLEWGVPLHHDRRLFEMLCLEGAQAGLSWLTILRRRAGYLEVYDGFDPAKVASYGQDKIDALLGDARIIRNRAKILASVSNARLVLGIQAEFGSLDRFLWEFTGGKPIQNSWRSLEEIPAETKQSQAMSKELRRRGFKFVGPTICYAFMQAAGMVNDHLVSCFRYSEIRKADAG